MKPRALSREREAELFRLLVIRRTLSNKSLRREFGITQSVINRVSRESRTNVLISIQAIDVKIAE